MLSRARDFEVAIKDKTINNDLWSVEPQHMPIRKTSKSAGYDICCAEEITIEPIWRGVLDCLLSKKPLENIDKIFKPTLVHTGIKAYMLDDEVLYLYNRSSNPFKKGLILANSVGVVDSDYYGNESNDGEIMFAFYNIFPRKTVIKKGEVIGQGVFSKFLKTDTDRAKEKKRVGGFGSTNEN